MAVTQGRSEARRQGTLPQSTAGSGDTKKEREEACINANVATGQAQHQSLDNTLSIEENVTAHLRGKHYRVVRSADMMLRTSKQSKKKSSPKGAKQILHKTSITLAGEKVNMSIKEKLTAELTDAKLGKYENVVKPYVLDEICIFAKQNSEFAQAIEQSDKSFADCLKASVAGAKEHISDLDCYKRAVAFYFPGADIKCTMTLDLGDNGFSNSKTSTEADSGKLQLDLDSLLDF